MNFNNVESITNIWHTKFVDISTLVKIKHVKGPVCQVEHADWPGKACVAKYKRGKEDFRRINRETLAYKWIQGHDIGPEFLAHIKDGDKVIGMLLEKLPGREAEGPPDFAACKTVVSKLHGLGLLHGDVFHCNILVNHERAWLVDFEHAEQCDDVRRFAVEMCHLKDELRLTQE